MRLCQARALRHSVRRSSAILLRIAPSKAFAFASALVIEAGGRGFDPGICIYCRLNSAGPYASDGSLMESNKIYAAILLAGVLAMIAIIASGMLVKPEELAKLAYPIEGVSRCPAGGRRRSRLRSAGRAAACEGGRRSRGADRAPVPWPATTSPRAARTWLARTCGASSAARTITRPDYAYSDAMREVRGHLGL
jgi:hypothetical protein